MSTTLASPIPKTIPQLPRVDIYSAIHRALRLFLGDTLARVGRLDPTDAGELADTLAQLNALLDTCRTHLEKENRFVHPALEARQPGGSVRIARDHDAHLESMAVLDADAAMLQAAPSAAAAQRLYRHLALFAAENHHHMHEEETLHNAALWAAYSDEEILAIEQAIIASHAPADMMRVVRWLIPALPPADRAMMLGGMQQGMPPEVFAEVLDTVRPHLDDGAWAKLARALALPQRPFSA